MYKERVIKWFGLLKFHFFDWNSRSINDPLRPRVSPGSSKVVGVVEVAASTGY